MPSRGNATRHRRSWTGGLVRIAWLAIVAMLLGPLTPRVAGARSEGETIDTEVLDAAEPPGMGSLTPATTQRKRRHGSGLAIACRRPPPCSRAVHRPRSRIEARRRIGVPRRVPPNDDDPDEAQG